MIFADVGVLYMLQCGTRRKQSPIEIARKLADGCLDSCQNVWLMLFILDLKVNNIHRTELPVCVLVPLSNSSQNPKSRKVPHTAFDSHRTPYSMELH